MRKDSFADQKVRSSSASATGSTGRHATGTSMPRSSPASSRVSFAVVCALFFRVLTPFFPPLPFARCSPCGPRQALFALLAPTHRTRLGAPTSEPPSGSPLCLGSERDPARSVASDSRPAVRRPPRARRVPPHRCLESRRVPQHPRSRRSGRVPPGSTDRRGPERTRSQPVLARRPPLPRHLLQTVLALVPALNGRQASTRHQRSFPR